jgi:hypothetical protein
MPTSGGASPSAANFGLGSLSESLKNLSRNPNGSSGASALTEIADWSTAEPVPEPEPVAQPVPEPEPVIEQAEISPIADEPIPEIADNPYEEEFISLESVAGTALPAFFEQSTD